ncbi:MAG: hypothetical protein NC040_09615, partial [Muribaculaceae bacterium]|nr:hypothetical protein [Muribaculaceae bacterium]
KWHVTYYYKNNQPCILIDNDSSGYVVVSGLSEFSLNPDSDYKKTPDKISIVKIIILVILCVIAIILLTYSLMCLKDLITELAENSFQEIEKTTSDELSLLIEVNKLIKEMLPMLLRILAITIPIVTIRQIIKYVK